MRTTTTTTIATPCTSRRPRTALLAVAASLLLAASLPAPAGAQKYPEPSVYPVSWELVLQYRTPKRIVVEVPGEPHPTAYWYMTYTVTNPGKDPVNYVPQFELVSDDGRIHRADKVIPSQVFTAIKARERNNLLQPARKVEGQLLPGEDQAKDGVAIWPEPQLRMGVFNIFAGGLSGEYVRMKDKDGKPLMTKNPVTKEDEEVVLRKQLQLTFHVAGDEVRPGEDPVHPKVEKWVMR